MIYIHYKKLVEVSGSITPFFLEKDIFILNKIFFYCAICVHKNVHTCLLVM